MMENHQVDEEKLREASCYGDIFAMADLVRKGVNVNSANVMNGWTALHWACQRGHSSAVELLLRSGADPSLANHRNQTPAQLTALPHIRAKLGFSDPALTPSSPTNSPSHESYGGGPELSSPVTNGNNNHLNNNNNSVFRENSRSTTATPVGQLENSTTGSSNDSIYGMSSKNSNSRSLSSQSSVASSRSSRSNRSSRVAAESSSNRHVHDGGVAGMGQDNTRVGVGYENVMAGLGHENVMARPHHANGSTASGAKNYVARPGLENGGREMVQENGTAFADPRRLSSSSCSSHSPPPLPTFRSSPPPLLSSPPSSPSPPPLLPLLHGKSSNVPYSAGISAARCSPPPLPKSPTEIDLELECGSPDAGERTPVNETTPTSPGYAPRASISDANFQISSKMNPKLEALEDENVPHFVEDNCSSPEPFQRDQWRADFDKSLNCAPPAADPATSAVHLSPAAPPSLQVSQDFACGVASNAVVENDNDDTFGQFIREGQASFFTSDHVEEAVGVSDQECSSQCKEDVTIDSARSKSLKCKEDFSKQANYCPSSNKGCIFEDQDHTSAFANIFCSSTVNYDLSLEEDPKDTVPVNCSEFPSGDADLFCISDDKRTSADAVASIDASALCEIPDSQNENGKGSFIDPVVENVETKHPSALGKEDSTLCGIDGKDEAGKSVEAPQGNKEIADATTNLIRFTSNLSLHKMADEAAAFSERALADEPVSSLLDDPAHILSPVDEILKLDPDPVGGNCARENLINQALPLGFKNPPLRVKSSGVDDVLPLGRHGIEDDCGSTVKQNRLNGPRSAGAGGLLDHSTAATRTCASGKDARHQTHSRGLQTEPEASGPRLFVEKRNVSTDPVEFAFEMHRRCCCCCCSCSHNHRPAEGGAGASQERTMVSKAVETDAVVPQVKEPEETIIKIRVGGSDDPDFIEVPLPEASPSAAHRTYGALMQLCCTHLYLNPHHVQRIRKLPNTRLRNDADVARLTSGAELELVVGGRGGVTGRGGGSGSAAFPARPMLY